MPWLCKFCRAQYDVPNNNVGLKCFKTPECKKKDVYACQWVAPVAAVAVLAPAEQAAALGYPNLYNSFLDKFPLKHKTNTMYVNASQTRGISYDGSTHSGDREGWKGFVKNAQGWNYSGSYQMNLDFWAHRPNDAQVPFPRGDA